MNTDDFSEIERELKQLRLRQPSARLRERIASELQRGERSLVPLAFRALLRFAMPVAAAAILTFVVVCQSSNNSSSTLRTKDPAPLAKSTTAKDKPASAWTPVGSKRVLVGLGEPGYAKLPDGTAVQLVRQLSVETFTWRDSRGSASLSVSLPIEEVRVVPSSSF